MIRNRATPARERRPEMTRSEKMIREAEAKRAVREGVRARVRLSIDLKKRAERCASAVGDDLMRWAFLSCVAMRSGKFDDVAFTETTQSATRDGSEVVWVRALANMKPAHVRLAIGCAVVYSEMRTPQRFETDLVEGRDYVVEKDQP